MKQAHHKSELNGTACMTAQEVADRLALATRRMILERRIATVRPWVRAVRVPEPEVRRIIEAGYTPRIDFAGRDGRYHNYHSRTI